jgi:hypothetical protein
MITDTDNGEQLTIEQLKKLKVAKINCLNSLLFHTRYFFKVQYNKKFFIGDPHRIICDYLERVLSGEITRLIINIAPRYGKTELAVKNFISVMALHLNPAAKFIHLSYSDDLALDNSEHVKELVQSAEYKQMFPEVQVKKNSDAKNKWYTTQNGGVLARAAGGSVTGFGAGEVDEVVDDVQDAVDAEMDEWLQSMQIAPPVESDIERKLKFAGAIIIDDPIKPEDADSDTLRERVNSRFDSTIRNRVNSRLTPIIVIAQRLHPNDLSGYLQRKDESDKWVVVELPSINAENNKYGLTPSAALLPWKHTLDELRKMEKANALVFGRQHMQNPSPKEGLLFPLSDLHLWDVDDAGLIAQLE